MLASSPSQILLLGTNNGDGTFTGVTTGESQHIDLTKGYDEICITFESVNTTSGGTLKIEVASRPNYTGTWGQIGSDVSASSFTGGAQLPVYVSPNAHSYLRVRISSDITGGGKVLVWLARQGS